MAEAWMEGVWRGVEMQLVVLPEVLLQPVPVLSAMPLLGPPSGNTVIHLRVRSPAPFPCPIQELQFPLFPALQEGDGGCSKGENQWCNFFFRDAAFK